MNSLGKLLRLLLASRVSRLRAPCFSSVGSGQRFEQKGTEETKGLRAKQLALPTPCNAAVRRKVCWNILRCLRCLLFRFRCGGDEAGRSEQGPSFAGLRRAGTRARGAWSVMLTQQAHTSLASLRSMLPPAVARVSRLLAPCFSSVRSGQRFEQKGTEETKGLRAKQLALPTPCNAAVRRKVCWNILRCLRCLLFRFRCGGDEAGRSEQGPSFAGLRRAGTRARGAWSVMLTQQAHASLASLHSMLPPAVARVSRLLAPCFSSVRSGQRFEQKGREETKGLCGERYLISAFQLFPLTSPPWLPL